MKRISVITALFSFFIASLHASDPIFLRITRDLREKVEISVLLSAPKDAYWEDFLKTVSGDLDYSGYFSVTGSVFTDNFSTARQEYKGRLAMIAEKTGEGLGIRVEGDPGGKALFEKKYPYPGPSGPRGLAHAVCNDLVFNLTGKPGIAGSRILFVSDRTGNYQLYQVEYDGENLKRLTDAKYMVHYPRWLYPGKELLFVSYKGGWPKLARKKIPSGEERVILSHPGLNACASPCLKTGELAVVLSHEGGPEIYITDFDGRILKRVTRNRATDASPSFSPCGKMISFVSDMHGSAQVYIMTREGTRIRRISYLSGYSTSPAWSPDGNLIAYVFLRGGSYGIAVYEVSTGETRVVAGAAGSEDVSWAPDSRHLVYSDISRKPGSVTVLDAVTGEKRKLTGGSGNSFSPGWGG